MEFQIVKNEIRDNIEIALRTAGYQKAKNIGQNTQLNFVKPLSQSGYPRFHIYLKESKTDYIFTLHLDQKRPIYKGAPAHSGEYNNKVVIEEAERVKQKLLVSDING
ncbi:MAG: hypothetical protein PHY72_04300 [Candidatus Pacebacteria bacterium]|nr:hypothetical protein [Candidatus Paceibacterota bacterium]